MSGHGAPSPGPQRSTSTGPNGSLTTPTSTAMVNGVTGAGVSVPAGSTTGGGSGPSAPSGGPVTQQNLNQIVIDYLIKKGYHKTEVTFRAESSNQEIPRDLEAPRRTPPVAKKYYDAYKALRNWTDDALDIYKPELQRFLWPMFVNCYIRMVEEEGSQNEAQRFMQNFREPFLKEHSDDITTLERVASPMHLQEDNIGKRYRDNKYRLVMSAPAHSQLMGFLESLPQKGVANGDRLLLAIIHENFDLREVDRAADDRFSFASVILRAKQDPQDYPAEDEGIPGHRPGNAIVSTDPAVGNVLANLKLGKLPLDSEVEAEVRAEVADLDLRTPPPASQPSFLQTHEMINIKQEDEDEGPTRTEIPYPPAQSRDVTMEVQKIRENRDRWKIESRTGGIGPGVSVCMYTFHNTHDSITCIDFSGDNQLVAAGMSESYIRVWTMDGKAIPNTDNANARPSNSRRLIGHSGPVYSVVFGPSIESSSANDNDTGTKWLLSCSMDSTIRLWNLEMFQQVVVYKGHVGPVWDVKWGPMGHYFVSAGSDKTARIWSTDKVRQLRVLAGHETDVEAVAWHPNSAYVFTAGQDRTVRMWSMTTGWPVRMFTGHTGNITSLACSTNGKTLASADDAGTVILWDLGSGRLLKRMRGHGKGGVWSLSWSVESSVLVSGGADQTVRLWDVVGPGKVDATAKTGEAKPGEAGVATASTAPATTTIPKKGKRDAGVSADQISAFLTKSSPVYKVRFTNMNLVIAGGAYLP